MINKKILGIVVLIFLLSSFTIAKKRNLNIVFIGDSITYGATLKSPKAEAPPVSASAYLQRQAKVGKVQFSNQGVSGFTTVDFLPSTGTAFKNVIKAANAFYKDKHALLIFSIMLGTNDSAIEGPNGSPVSPADYRANMKAIIDRLLQDYPQCRIVIQYPTWYSPNTYNGAKYLQQGLSRLQKYSPELDRLIARYSKSNPNHVFTGNKSGFRYFKKHHLQYLTPQKGHKGTFYLHPNKAGAVQLGHLWAKAIYKIICLSEVK